MEESAPKQIRNGKEEKTDKVKLTCYGLFTVKFLFFVWLLSSMIVDSRFKTQEERNENILIFELILAGVMLIGAVYLRLRQLKEIVKN